MKNIFLLMLFGFFTFSIVSIMTYGQGLDGGATGDAGGGASATPTKCPYTDLGVCSGGRDTATPTATNTGTPTATNTGTPTPSNTPTNTFTPTATGTWTFTPTPTNTAVPGSTDTPSPTPTNSATITIPDYNTLIAVCNNGSRWCLVSVDEGSDPGLCTGALGGLTQIISGTTDTCTDFTPTGTGTATTGDSPASNVGLQARCLCGTEVLYISIASYSLGTSTCAAQSVGSIPCIFNGYVENLTPTPTP